MDEPGSGRYLQMRWSRVGIASLLVAIASVGSLVIVASIKEADTLATVALALAVLAFVVQILTYIGDSITSAAQHREFQRINTETSMLLAELRTHAVDTNQLVSRQFDKVLDQFFLRAKGADLEVEDQGERQKLLAELRAEADRFIQTDISGSTTVNRRFGVAVSDPNAEVWLRRLRAGVEREQTLRKLVEEHGVAGLSEEAVRLLEKLTFDLLTSLEAGLPDGVVLSLDAPGYAECVDAGLVGGDASLVNQDAWGEATFVRLTTEGRSVAALIASERAGRPGTLEAIPWLAAARRRFREEHRGLDAP